MEQERKQLIIEARHDLWARAEFSGQEVQTRAYIKAFLGQHTSLQLFDQGAWLYAKHDEGAEKTVVVRADHDAVPTLEGPRHLCGHDGHTAALLGLGLLLEGKTLGKNVILLFQHAEETGAGGAACCALFQMEGLTRENACILGCHNIPGEAFGTALFRRGTFACASCGLDISLTGRPTHAAYPENGINPSAAVARLALELPAIAAQISEKHGCMTLATVVGMRTGERAFGVAASEGRLWVTLRAETDAAFGELNQKADEAICTAASTEKLRVAVSREDVFPATENDDFLQNALESVCKAKGLPYKYLDVPFRWSEDFGHYGQHLPACFFGVGAGPDTPPLHTESFIYPDALAPVTAELFFHLLSV